MTGPYRGICPVCGRELGLTRGAGRIPPHVTCVEPEPCNRRNCDQRGRCAGSRDFPTPPETGAIP